MKQFTAQSGKNHYQRNYARKHLLQCREQEKKFMQCIRDLFKHTQHIEKYTFCQLTDLFFKFCPQNLPNTALHDSHLTEQCCKIKRSRCLQPAMSNKLLCQVSVSRPSFPMQIFNSEMTVARVTNSSFRQITTLY